MIDILRELQEQSIKNFYKFRKYGLEKYGNYLEIQFKNSQNKKIKEKYHNYIANEIEKNNKRLKDLESKL